MLNTVMVIENFYEDPHKVRKIALNMTYPEPPETTYYPGRNSNEMLLPPNTNDMFSFILREKLVGATRRAHGHFRYSLANSRRPAEIHIDPGVTWAGVVCLTLDKDCRGGTEFFRHKKFGTDRAPLTDEEAQQVYGMQTRSEVVQRLIYDDGHHLDRWERTHILPLKFNQCALFRPWLWHTSGVDFGSSIENGRLVQLLFLDATDPKTGLAAPNLENTTGNTAPTAPP